MGRDRAALFSPCFGSSGEELAPGAADEPMFSESMKSSMFMGSDVDASCSEFLRNWAMPLGALWAESPILLDVVTC